MHSATHGAAPQPSQAPTPPAGSRVILHLHERPGPQVVKELVDRCALVEAATEVAGWIGL